jgi:hypothetical protein
MISRIRVISKTRVVVLAGALLLPLIALGIWHEFIKPDVSLNPVNPVVPLLWEYGYIELVPPTRFFGPGTINTVETLPNGSLKLHPTCTMDKEVLIPLWQVSTTVNMSVAESVKNTLEAAVNAENVVTSGAAGEQIKRISVSLQNTRIITISDEDLLNVRQKHLKGTCEYAVTLNLQSGAKVCQTMEVLQADIVYRMHFADGLEIKQKFALTKLFAASLDLAAAESQTNVIRGDDLYYGVKKHSQVSCIILGGNTNRFPAASHRTGDVVQ